MDPKCGSQSFNNVCTSWNKGVRRISNLSHDIILRPFVETEIIKGECSVFLKKIYYG